MNHSASPLNDRGVIKLTGAETEKFLQKLITNSVLEIPAGEGRYSALLTAQGKILFDFFIVPLPEGPEAGYFVDCVKEQAADLVKRLTFHRMRWKVGIEDLSESLGVIAMWGGDLPADHKGILAYRDPRDPAIGLRVIAPRETLASLAPNEAAYEAHRIALGVPKGGVDFVYGDTFVHEANLDSLHGVDFKKGCYVGQEVVARVHFRNSARKRIVKVHFDGSAPSSGTEVRAGETAIGLVGSIFGSEGLAMLRLDRLDDAKAAGTPVKAGEIAVDIEVPQEFIEKAAGVEKRL
jgi:folate-binding protein YgfZ